MPKNNSPAAAPAAPPIPMAGGSYRVIDGALVRDEPEPQSAPEPATEPAPEPAPLAPGFPNPEE